LETGTDELWKREEEEKFSPGALQSLEERLRAHGSDRTFAEFRINQLGETYNNF
jgi:hypothetical protein